MIKNVNTEKNLIGLKNHNEEINSLTIESTTEALLILMEKTDYDKISITDICNKAGISRTAFYKNFKSKENLFETVLINFGKNLLKKIGNPFSKILDKHYFEKLFNYIKENVKFFLVLIKNNCKHLYMDILNKKLSSNENLEIKHKYKRIMWLSSILNLIFYWIENNMKESVEEMASICFSHITSPVLSCE